MVASLLHDDAEIESVVECGDARSVREAVATERPDILFLDIEMPEETGLDVAADLAEEGPVVVFVTAYREHATTAFDVNASDYVLKPFSDERCAQALHRAKERVRHRRLGDLASQLATLSPEVRVPTQTPVKGHDTGYLKRLAFKHDGRSIILKTADVMWIEAEDYYVKVHSRLGRHLIRASLASLEERLDPGEFLRVHRGALVNIEEIRELRERGAILSDGTEVPVSRSRKTAVEAALTPRLRLR